MLITSHPFTVARQDGPGPHPADYPCAATVPNGLNGHVVCGKPLREHAAPFPDFSSSTPAPEPELWVAYNAAGPTYAVYFSEIEALRHAVGESMDVERIHPGELWEQISKARAARGAR